ncbi:hypothetical protein BT96DRAFT_936321 [Gymnopus androsaceus JB14]|uniref:Uncharacterized protein n=1 Tax=Gymnopus androsaceus JB14 TaxID=1447944 RepID=A0A6A4I4J6_9AGAR|nr:hypothetical protein BT96DRAFT_936321 [Gymnopus androsaceus JB14]
MPPGIQFTEPVICNPVDASQVSQLGPIAPSQTVLSLINTSTVPVALPNYRPAASSTRDFLNAEGLHVSSKSLSAAKSVAGNPSGTSNDGPPTLNVGNSSLDSGAMSSGSAPSGPAPLHGDTPSGPAPLHGDNSFSDSHTTPSGSLAQASALPKHKKGQMGAEEKRMAHAAAHAKCEQLTEAVRDSSAKVPYCLGKFKSNLDTLSVPGTPREPRLPKLPEGPKGHPPFPMGTRLSKWKGRLNLEVAQGTNAGPREITSLLKTL